eukprot:gene7832-8682_t
MADHCYLGEFVQQKSPHMANAYSYTNRTARKGSSDFPRYKGVRSTRRERAKNIEDAKDIVVAAIFKRQSFIKILQSSRKTRSYNKKEGKK